MIASRNRPRRKIALEDDHWRSRSAKKRPRARPYVMEYRYRRFQDNRWTEWAKWSAYETIQQCTRAFEQRTKAAHPGVQYRLGHTATEPKE